MYVIARMLYRNLQESINYFNQCHLFKNDLIKIVITLNIIQSPLWRQQRHNSSYTLSKSVAFYGVENCEKLLCSKVYRGRVCVYMFYKKTCLYGSARVFTFEHSLPGNLKSGMYEYALKMHEKNLNRQKSQQEAETHVVGEVLCEYFIIHSLVGAASTGRLGGFTPLYARCTLSIFKY